MIDWSKQNTLKQVAEDANYYAKVFPSLSIASLREELFLGSAQSTSNSNAMHEL